jgi:hypothetical protein
MRRLYSCGAGGVRKTIPKEGFGGGRRSLRRAFLSLWKGRNDGIKQEAPRASEVRVQGLGRDGNNGIEGRRILHWRGSIALKSCRGTIIVVSD